MTENHVLYTSLFYYQSLHYLFHNDLTTFPVTCSGIDFVIGANPLIINLTFCPSL